MRTHSLIFITLLFSLISFFSLTNGKNIKVPSGVAVQDEPGEDDCDYNYYLWRALNNDVLDIDYYQLLDIERVATEKDIRRGYRKQSRLWDEWSNSCGIRNFDKARGDVMLSDAFKTLNTADLRKNYDSNLKQPPTVFDKISTQVSKYFSRLGGHWKALTFGMVGLAVLQVVVKPTLRTQMMRSLGLQKKNPVISELRLQRLRRLQKNK